MTYTSGRYDLQYEVGRGAAGTVWGSWDTKLERRVAVKILHGSSPSDTDAIRRFEQEARTVAQLHSPYVVRIYDVGTDNGRSFMVTELLEGESLEARLCRHGSLPLSISVGIASDICRGLRAIHRAGVIHRDIKPANVFLAVESGREIAKLLDFGVATLVGPNDATFMSPLVSGTPLFMCPEQLGGKPANVDADLWSLAVSVYRMITGKFPFSGTTVHSLVQQMLGESFRAPSAVASELGEEVDKFFGKAFASQEKDRFRTVDEFSKGLHCLASKASPITRILFIDDEPDMQLLLTQRFRHQVRDGKYELLYASDGQAGLEQLRRRPDVDVVVTDLNMPGMDGLTFLARVPDVNPFVRVVVVSAYGDMANIRTAMNRGSFDFLGKPIDFQDLETTIEKCAAHVEVVRQALHSSEENQVMRVLLGQGVTDRWIHALRSNDSPSSQVEKSSVVFVDVYGFARTMREPFPVNALEHLNAFLSLFSRELQSKGGRVIRFVGDAVFAVFEGDEHVIRAADACLAIRTLLMEQSTCLAPQLPTGHGVAIGIDTGKILSGAGGSLELGHVEPLVLGEAVSMAARLHVMARRNEILVSQRIAALLPDSYQCQVDLERTILLRAEERPLIALLRRRNSPSSRGPQEETTAGNYPIESTWCGRA